MQNVKKLFVKTYGCQMNVYDTERMTESLQAEGYISTDSAEEADMILLNTCHIREKAAEKVYSELGRFKHLKSENPNLKIGVVGCVAQAEGEEIIRRQPLVDLVVGPQSYHKLPLLERQINNGQKKVEIDFPTEDKFDFLAKRTDIRRAPAAFLTIQEGCDKFCAFCVVPYTRGAEVSRPVEKVVSEVHSLVDRGVKEITLLGQNVNAYHGTYSGNSQFTLAQLIWKLEKISGLERIRYTTSHPNDMTDDLIDAHANCQKLMPYLHLPVQSGSNKILKKMNRSHTAEAYVDLISRVRKARPDILISGDFIVGFPEETDDDFSDTMELIRKVKYGQSYSFKYSVRPGTPAAERMQVPEGKKNIRLQELQKLLSEQQKTVQEDMVGRTVSVLFEKTGRQIGQVVGKSDYLHAVHVPGEENKVGLLENVLITGSNTNSLKGKIV
ncbi:tRNA (N6-isopentenyl adenosine(37)-C2)-methylthiotransferase MiaB [Paracoccaceae bacterium]|nr:tRNA (N6-isopentenyl adenosine(37)-C2)-methylthiotransferase MiaB [Paracoccaceae bacterium]MDB3861231.1 tRNA (N6-isopentenyl adenosine(37)-C2)-methylthiotransferase MiaB [Paracoccaceae bacterium]